MAKKGSVITPFTLKRRSSFPTSTIDDPSPAPIPAGPASNSPNSPFSFCSRFAARPSSREPILALKLSNPSFLETTVIDDFSGSHLYTVQTRGRSTAVFRSSPTTSQAAWIRWPDPSRLKGKNKEDFADLKVQMAGERWRMSEDFFWFGSMFTSRKFILPHVNVRLKWRRMGSSYHCTTRNVKGPVAILEPSVVSSSPRIRIYDTIYSMDDEHFRPQHRGVPLLFLDYIIATAFLMLTDVDEWLEVIRPGESTMRSRAPNSAPASNPASVEQWRQMLHSEFAFDDRDGDRDRDRDRDPSEADTNPTTWESRSRASSRSSNDPISPVSAPTQTYSYQMTRHLSYMGRLNAEASSSSSGAGTSSGSRSNPVYGPTVPLRTVSNPTPAMRRELPAPPIPLNATRSDQPWLLHTTPSRSTLDIPVSNVATASPTSPAYSHRPDSPGYVRPLPRPGTQPLKPKSSKAKISRKLAREMREARPGSAPSGDARRGPGTHPPQPPPPLLEGEGEGSPAGASPLHEYPPSTLQSATLPPTVQARLRRIRSVDDENGTLPSMMEAMTFARRESLYSLYEAPPPAYDTIDWSLPSAQVPYNPHHDHRHYH